MKDKLYGVLALKEKLGVEVMGMTTTLELNWYDGQIGAMPVFNDYDKALEYMDGNKDRVFELDIVNNAKDSK